MLILDRSHYELLLRQATAGTPKEVCGLIAGVERELRRSVKKIYPLVNMDDSAEHFTMDPREQFAAIKDMRQNDWTLLGNYHSHPASPARPSQEDIRLAFDPASSYLILSLADAQNPVLRSFRIQNGAVAEEIIKIVEGNEKVLQVDYKTLKKNGLMSQIQKDHFAMRLKVVGGQVTTEQLQKIREIADKYGRGYIHLTSRQGIEIPFIRLEDIEAVKAELAEGGVSLGTCGPRVRTITACQGAAICPTGLIDTTVLAEDLDQRFGGREVPHKFKFGITGCRNNCLKAEENDLGFKGGLQPVWAAEKCTYCGLCEVLCPTEAIKIDKQERRLDFDETKCSYCGKCAKGCPVGAWSGKNGYILYFGGLFGNQIATAKQILPIVFEKEKLFTIVEKTLAFFIKHGRPGERFRHTLDRVGWDLLKQELTEEQ